MDRKLDDIKETQVESMKIQVESMKKQEMAAQQIQDQISAVAAQQAKTLDVALSNIMANASAGGRAIITYSEPAKARILASKAEQERARYKAQYPNLKDYNRLLQVSPDSSFCLMREQSADLFID